MCVQGFLADKDAQIAELHQELRDLNERLVASNMDTEKTSVAALSRALEERDRQIDTLKKRLDEAAGDILVDADLMDEVRLELKQSESVALAAAAAAWFHFFLSSVNVSFCSINST